MTYIPNIFLRQPKNVTKDHLLVLESHHKRNQNSRSIKLQNVYIALQLKPLF